MSAPQSAEQGHFRLMIEWAGILENGVGVAADPVKARDLPALSAELQTEQKNLWMTSSQSAAASQAPIETQKKLPIII
jgi:hypothetical protein